MARRRRNRTSRQRTREASDFANLFRLRTRPPSSRSGRLLAIDDRRTFPRSDVLPHGLRRRVARVVLGPARPRSPSQTGGGRDRGGPPRLKFRNPEAVLVCYRRQARKQVIHAKGIAGGRVKKPRRTYLSEISCRR